MWVTKLLPFFQLIKEGGFWGHPKTGQGMNQSRAKLAHDYNIPLTLQAVM